MFNVEKLLYNSQFVSDEILCVYIWKEKRFTSSWIPTMHHVEKFINIIKFIFRISCAVSVCIYNTNYVTVDVRKNKM